jgi:hypothetical protein
MGRGSFGKPTEKGRTAMAWYENVNNIKRRLHRGHHLDRTSRTLTKTSKMNYDPEPVLLTYEEAQAVLNAINHCEPIVKSAMDRACDKIYKAMHDAG